MRTLLLALMLSLAACTTTQHVTTALQLPRKPELPTVPSSQMQCLSDDTYKALAIRDRRLREYAEELETVIRSTHEDTP